MSPSLLRPIRPKPTHPPTRRRVTLVKWGIPAVVAVILVAGLAVIQSSAPSDVLSTDKKVSTWEPEISPMGKIARGDEPIPDLDALSKRHAQFQAPRASLALQGNDVLVHSPTANGFQSETTIDVNGDQVVVGYNDIRGFYLPSVSVSGYSYSSDGGATWTDGGQLPTTGTGDEVYGDPDVKTWTDGGGQRYFFFSSLYVTPSGNSSLCVHVSTDGGATWSQPREVTTATSATDFPDKEFMGVDPETGRIFISWTNFGSGTTMRVTYSDNFGLSWNGPWVFSTSVGQGSVPRADGSSDNVYITWTSGTSIVFVRSTDNGVTWGTPSVIQTNTATPMNPYGSDRIHGFPGMDVDPVNGNIYIVYAMRNLAPDFSDVYFKRSTNGGLSWSNAITLNALPGSDRSQYFPWICVDKDGGDISAIWYDQILGDGTSDITDLFHTHSYDGGLTWDCPTPLTDDRFHAEYGNDTSQPNMGDYNQCVMANGTLYASFAKTDEPSYTTYAPDTYVDISHLPPPDAPIVYNGINFADVGCASLNGYLEPGETVDLYVTVENYSNCVSSITNVNGALSTPTPGVTITVPNQTFSDLAGAGSTSSNILPFQFTIAPGFTCGDDIDFLLTVTSALGTALVPFSHVVGRPVVTNLLLERFDGVAAPNLPAGWTSANITGTVNPWVTSTTYAATGPNSAFCANISTTSLNELASPAITVPANCGLLQVTFRITHDIEDDYERKAWDGALLRIRVNGSVTELAGAFASHFDPFYPWQMNRQSSSTQPFQDMSCWSSDVTPNFNSVTMQFKGLAGQSVELLFDMSTDNAVGTATGMFVDDVAVDCIAYDCTCTDPPLLTLIPPAVFFNAVPVNATSCDTVRIVNEGATDLHISSFTGCDSPPFSVDTTMTAWTIPAGDTTKFVVCVTPATQGPDTCLVTLTSDAANGPIHELLVALGVVTGAGDATPVYAFDGLTVAPNPFNPTTTVRFNLPERMPVTAEVWSVNGARVKVLARDEMRLAGPNEIHWMGRNDAGHPVASGVYFIRVKTRLGEHVARAVLLK